MNESTMTRVLFASAMPSIQRAEIGISGAVGSNVFYLLAPTGETFSVTVDRIAAGDIPALCQFIT